MKKYNNYKKYNERWLDQLPAHWQVMKGKWLFNKEERPVRKEDDIITCFRDGQVTLRINRKTDGFTNALKEHGYQGIRKGDLVIHAMDAFAGAIGISDSDGKSSPVYSACTPRRNDIQPYYYSYFMRNLARNGYIQALAKGIRERSTDFRFSDFGVLLLPLPPLQEQNKIIDYLDQKTSQIDKAITQKQQIIELLKERKQILINKAVTRGLNPDVPLKDSGIDWIGEIPEHWEIKPLFAIVTNKSDKNHPDYEILSVYREYGVIPKDSRDDNHNATSLDTASYKAVYPGDLVVNKMKAWQGSMGISNYQGIVSPAYITCSIISNKIYSYFLHLLLRCNSYISEYNRLSYGVRVGQWDMHYEDFKRIPIIFPCLSEQKAISNYIEQQTTQIDKTITQKHLEIEKLKEYKATLIDSAVTGKICLTDN